MSDDRDYAGMYEIEPGVFAMRVHLYEDDSQMRATHTKIDALTAIVEGILERLEGGIKVKQVTSIL